MKVETVKPNEQGQGIVQYSMTVDLDVLKHFEKMAATFNTTDVLSDYRETHHKDPTVYFKFFWCWWAEDKTYVNANQLAALMGLNIQLLNYEQSPLFFAL